MEIESLVAISPIDGRYRSKTVELAHYFSEYGLFKYRLLVEIEYFIALCKLPLPQLESFNKNYFPGLRKIYTEFGLEDARRIKEIEATTNHDVKAVEYYLREMFDELGIYEYKEFIHFGLTSQDINNTAIPYLLSEAYNNIYYPLLQKVIDKLFSCSEEWKDITMLGRTHGQPASPTKLGKELRVFHERIVQQTNLLSSIPNSAKFGGATGNFNAHYAAYPDIDWVSFADDFVNNTLGLERDHYTTQIEHYDNIGAFFDALKRINTILLDLSKDMWLYISFGYFRQKIKSQETGSSVMPHKVNPIDFENAEGNLGIANSYFEHLAGKLPVSRLQRDLTDSTVIRNVGMPISYTIISLKSLLIGLDKLMVNQEKIDNDLEQNWAIVSEAIQTILRREQYPNPYEAVKQLTRTNQTITKKELEKFVDSLSIDESVKKEIKRITPFNYTGFLE